MGYPPVGYHYPPPMAPRRWWLTRKWLLIGGIGIGLLTFVILFFTVIYGRIGAYMIESKMVPKLEKKLGRTVEIGDVDVSAGMAVLENVVIKGPKDKGEPLVRIARIEAEVGFWA